MMHRLMERDGSMRDGNFDAESTFVRSDPTGVGCCYLTIAGLNPSMPTGGSPKLGRNRLQGLLKWFRLKASKLRYEDRQSASMRLSNEPRPYL
jgi:hypothetical protein